MLVKPHTEDEFPTNIPFTVCLVREGRITLRLANIDERDIYVCQGAQLDIASTNASVLANRKQEKGDKSVSHRQRGYYRWQLGQNPESGTFQTVGPT